MKLFLKNKLMLKLITVVSFFGVAVGGVSTYAWFQINNSANASQVTETKAIDTSVKVHQNNSRGGDDVYQREPTEDEGQTLSYDHSKGGAATTYYIRQYGDSETTLQMYQNVNNVSDNAAYYNVKFTAKWKIYNAADNQYYGYTAIDETCPLRPTNTEGTGYDNQGNILIGQLGGYYDIYFTSGNKIWIENHYDVTTSDEMGNETGYYIYGTTEDPNSSLVSHVDIQHGIPMYVNAAKNTTDLAFYTGFRVTAGDSFFIASGEHNTTYKVSASGENNYLNKVAYFSLNGTTGEITVNKLGYYSIALKDDGTLWIDPWDGFEVDGTTRYEVEDSEHNPLSMADPSSKNANVERKARRNVTASQGDMISGTTMGDNNKIYLDTSAWSGLDNHPIWIHWHGSSGDIYVGHSGSQTLWEVTIPANPGTGFNVVWSSNTGTWDSWKRQSTDVTLSNVRGKWVQISSANEGSNAFTSYNWYEAGYYLIGNGGIFGSSNFDPTKKAIWVGNTKGSCSAAISFSGGEKFKKIKMTDNKGAWSWEGEVDAYYSGVTNYTAGVTNDGDNNVVISSAFTCNFTDAQSQGAYSNGSIYLKVTTYTVTLNKNGGTINAGNITSYFYSVGATLPTNVTKTGYTFGGWWTNAGCTEGETTTISTSDSGNKTFYAKWTAKQYNITYKDQGNVAFSGTHETGYPTKHTYNSATTLKTASKTGYTFDGWFTTQACTGSAVTSLGATAYTADITLYAKWIAKQTSVTLDRQGGTTGSTSVTATYNSAMPSTTMPTREGYTFAGYFTGQNGNGTQYYNANGSSTRNWNFEDASKTLYAKWTATITLDQTNATTQGTTSVTATYNSAMPAGITVPVRTGYSFGGYYTETNGGGTKYYSSTGTSMHVSDLATGTTLYPLWVYTITLNVNGGTAGSMHTKIYHAPMGDYYRDEACDEKMTSSANEIIMPTNDSHLYLEGYTFTDGSGYCRSNNYINSDGYLTAYATTTTGLTELEENTDFTNRNRTLYAFWSQCEQYWAVGSYKYTVTLNQNGATTQGTTTIYSIKNYYDSYHYFLSYSSSNKKLYGEITTVTTSITLPQKVVNDIVYSFDGYYDGNGTQYITSQGFLNSDILTTSHNNITLTARWVRKYSVSLNNQGADVGHEGTANIWENYSDGFYLDSACTNANVMATDSNPIASCPVKTGYLFGGYWTSNNGGTTLVTQYISASGYITNSASNTHFEDNGGVLYAKWTPIWTITLDNRSATTPGSGYIYETQGVGFYLNDDGATNPMGSSTNRITVPTKTGYTFGGYWKDSSCTDTQVLSATGYILSVSTSLFDSNDTIYAKWVVDVYTITLNNNSANVRAGTAAIYLKYGVGYYSNPECTESISTITIPRKDGSDTILAKNDGRSFRGYGANSDGTGTSYIDLTGNITANTTAFTQNKTIYALWVNIMYVNIDVNNGTGVSATTRIWHEDSSDGGKYYLDVYGEQEMKQRGTVLDNQNYHLNVVTLTGYTLRGYSGWRFDDSRLYLDNEGYLTAVGAANTANLDNVLGTHSTIVADWMQKVYTVTLNNQGALVRSGTSTIYEVYYNGSESGTNIGDPGGYYLNYNGSYNIVAGTIGVSNKMTAGSPGTNGITTPQKAGHTFGGYYTSNDGGDTLVTQYIDANGYVVNTSSSPMPFTANTTLYAKWTIINYNYYIYGTVSGNTNWNTNGDLIGGPGDAANQVVTTGTINDTTVTWTNVHFNSGDEWRVYRPSGFPTNNTGSTAGLSVWWTPGDGTLLDTTQFASQHTGNDDYRNVLIGKFSGTFNVTLTLSTAHITLTLVSLDTSQFTLYQYVEGTGSATYNAIHPTSSTGSTVVWNTDIAFMAGYNWYIEGPTNNDAWGINTANNQHIKATTNWGYYFDAGVTTKGSVNTVKDIYNLYDMGATSITLDVASTANSIVLAGISLTANQFYIKTEGGRSIGPVSVSNNTVTFSDATLNTDDPWWIRVGVESNSRYSYVYYKWGSLATNVTMLGQSKANGTYFYEADGGDHNIGTGYGGTYTISFATNTNTHTGFVNVTCTALALTDFVATRLDPKGNTTTVAMTNVSNDTSAHTATYTGTVHLYIGDKLYFTNDNGGSKSDESACLHNYYFNGDLVNPTVPSSSLITRDGQYLIANVDVTLTYTFVFLATSSNTTKANLTINTPTENTNITFNHAEDAGIYLEIANNTSFTGSERIMMHTTTNVAYEASEAVNMSSGSYIRLVKTHSNDSSYLPGNTYSIADLTEYYYVSTGANRYTNFVPTTYTNNSFTNPNGQTIGNGPSAYITVSTGGKWTISLTTGGEVHIVLYSGTSTISAQHEVPYYLIGQGVPGSDIRGCDFTIGKGVQMYTYGGNETSLPCYVGPYNSNTDPSVYEGTGINLKKGDRFAITSSTMLVSSFLSVSCDAFTITSNIVTINQSGLYKIYVNGSGQIVITKADSDTDWTRNGSIVASTKGNNTISIGGNLDYSLLDPYMVSSNGGYVVEVELTHVSTGALGTLHYTVTNGNNYAINVNKKENVYGAGSYAGAGTDITTLNGTQTYSYSISSSGTHNVCFRFTIDPSQLENLQNGSFSVSISYYFEETTIS